MGGVRSLTARVLLLATAWSAVALVVIAIVISQLYRQSAERAFTDLLRAQLYNVINSMTIGDDNKLSGSPQLGDLRFSQPETGWYWIIEPLGTFAASPISSSSLGTSNIKVPTILSVPFNNRYERFYQTYDAFGNHVLVAENGGSSGRRGPCGALPCLGQSCRRRGRHPELFPAISTLRW